MVILDSRESLILGDIAVTPDLTRSEAELALSSGVWFYRRRKNFTEF
ncbi:hypothetical protein TRSA_26670 (plasmid) [Treponema saccharophilum]|nr:hypothetical protein TRSA_26670 [Treponema saccharophilum]